MLAADLFTNIVLGDRSEARLRLSQGPTAGFDLATTPSAALDLHARRVEFAVSYAPSFTLGDIETGGSFQVFQIADAHMRFVARRTSLTLATGGSYGDYNFTYLLPTSAPTGPTPPPPQAVPTATTVRFGSSRTAGSIRRTWRRWSFTISGEHSVAGGLDEASRVFVPLISSPSASLALSWDATRVDALTTSARATVTDSTPRPCNPATGGPPLIPNALTPTCAPNDEWAELRETWRHVLGRGSVLTLAAGASLVRQQIDRGAPDTFTPEPSGEATLSQNLGTAEPWRSKLELTARVTPVVDIRYAIVESRAEGDVRFTYGTARDKLTASVSLVRSIPPTTIDATYVDFALEGVHQLDKRVGVGVGSRGAWQHDAITDSFFIVGFYVTFIWQSLPFRL
ncbi:MAG TPA: hypothetical protein VGH28_21580 [Polyangiaceae bacterium]